MRMTEAAYARFIKRGRDRDPRPRSRTEVSLEEGRALIAALTPEDQLQAFVKDAAVKNGWRYYHTYRSTKSDEGFYDVVAIHRRMRRLIFAELKATRGTFSDEQAEWREDAEEIAQAIASLLGLGDDRRNWPVAYYEWRPKDKDEIIEVFRWTR